MTRNLLKQEFLKGKKITQEKMHALIDFDQVKIYDAGSVSGNVELDLANGSFQIITITDDVTNFTIDNLDDTALFLHVDNTGDYGVNVNFADYKVGVIPAGSFSFSMVIYAINSDIYLTIGEEYV